MCKSFLNDVVIKKKMKTELNIQVQCAVSCCWPPQIHKKYTFNGAEMLSDPFEYFELKCKDVKRLICLVIA